MAEGPQDGPLRDPTPAGKDKRAIANEQRLAALGSAIEKKSGLRRKSRRPQIPHHRSRKWIVSSVVVVMLIVGVLGGGYLYAQYRFRSIHKLHVGHEAYPVPGQP